LAKRPASERCDRRSQRTHVGILLDEEKS
jgi:hypothetical protein